jgi:hypothetical protein
VENPGKHAVLNHGDPEDTENLKLPCFQSPLRQDEQDEQDKKPEKILSNPVHPVNNSLHLYVFA